MVGFIKAWGLVIVSLCYTFSVAKLVPKGMKRLVMILPVLLIFFIVPLLMSSIQLIGKTAFYITWLANFKLLLFAFGRGPLSSNSKPLSLPIFLAVSCLPIKIESKPKPDTSHFQGGSIKGVLVYIIKAALFILNCKVYDYSSMLPEKVVLTFYVIQIYLYLELVLPVSVALARAMTGREFEPQFDKPHLATSLQIFWGRRWNLMVTGILRPTVYQPMIQVLSVFTKKWSKEPAVFVTFAVSGLMHQLIFYYIGRLEPDWKITGFFLINGFCTAVEIAIKKKVNGRWRLPTAISRVLTIAFVMVTALLLFVPEFKRCNIFERSIDEYVAVGMYAAGIGSRLAT